MHVCPCHRSKSLPTRLHGKTKAAAPGAEQQREHRHLLEPEQRLPQQRDTLQRHATVVVSTQRHATVVVSTQR